MVGHVADAQLGLYGLLFYVIATHLNITRGEGLNAYDTFNNGRFTGTVRAKETKDLAALYRKGNVIYRVVLVVAVFFRELAQDKGRGIVTADGLVDIVSV